MNSTQTTDSKRPLPIDIDALNYLKTRLNIADTIKVWDKTAEKQEYNYDYPGIGNIKVYEDSNLGPTIQFSPSGWSQLYKQDLGNILKDLSGIISDPDLTCEMKIIYPSVNIDNNNGPCLTFYEAGELELALNTECVQIYTEYGINLLQNLWGKMIYRFDRKVVY